MTVKQTKELTIPAWVVSILSPIILAVIGYAVGLSSINAKAGTEIDNIKEDVVRIEASKASNDKVDAVQVTLIRIEGKLDGHITNSNK